MANLNELLDGHVTLEVECIDRLYLNGYVRVLATGGGLFRFLTEHLRQPVASPVLLGQITQRFVAELKEYGQQLEIPVLPFEHGERKDERASREPHAATATGQEGRRAVRIQPAQIGVGEPRCPRNCSPAEP